MYIIHFLGIIKECIALYSMEINFWKFTTFLVNKNIVRLFFFWLKKKVSLYSSVSFRFLSCVVNCGKC